jgi:co-chaperonin GroES (HSP10)
MFRPKGDWALIQMEPAIGESKSAGGIVLTHPELIRKGIVISVGPGRHYVDGVYKPTELKMGDRVAFLAATMDTQQGHQIAHLLEKDQALIRETDVLFVIDEGDPRIEK